MLNKVDHLVYACQDLAEGLDIVENLLGVKASAGGRHPAFGTHNKLFSLGDACFLEVIAPDPERVSPDLPSIFHIDKISRPRITTWAAKESAMVGRLKKLKQQGIDFGAMQPGQRQKPDGTIISWQLTNPYKVLGDGLIPFLIDWGNTPNPGLSAAKGCQLLDLKLFHPVPSNCQAILDALDLPIVVEPGATPKIMARIACPNGIVELY